MNENKQELRDRILEEILKEFGHQQPETEGGEAAPEEPAAEAVSQPAAEAVAEPAAEEPQPEPEEEEVQIPPAEEPEQSEAVPSDTIRLDNLSQVATETAPQPESPAEEAPEETAESENTEDEPSEEEPEEEEAQEDVIIPERIVFRPRSRLRELKRQLIAGPEKRYYELSEIGTGKLTSAIFLGLLVILISAGAAALYAADMVPSNRLRLMIFGQVLAMLFGGLLGSHEMIDGMDDVLHGKFTLNTLLALTFCACCIDSVFCLMELRVPICAAFTLDVVMALWSTLHRRSTEMGQMDTMRKAIRLDSLVKEPDLYEGRAGFLRGEGRVEDFMESYRQVSRPEKVQNTYALISLLVSIVIAVAAGLLHGISMGFQILTTTLLVAVPASFFISYTRPLAVLERRLHSLGTVLCGWKGIRDLSGKAVFPVNDTDIFPYGATKLNGVKFYGERDPEDVIAYAASLICAGGDGLAPVFQQLLESRSGRFRAVENMRHYPAGGIGGEIEGDPVLVGTMSFLQDMGVEIPEGTSVNQAVYLSIDGQLCGLFAITYTRTKFSASGLATLCTYRGLTPVVIAGDFMLTGAFLRSKFSVNPKRIIFPERPQKLALAARKPDAEAPALALITKDGLAPAAYAVTGARAMVTASNLGLVIHMIGGILGMLIMGALAVVGAVELLTPINVLLYQLIWSVPGFLITEWTRTI